MKKLFLTLLATLLICGTVFAGTVNTGLNVPDKLCADLASGTGITLGTGNADIAAISYVGGGSTLEANVTDVTDITDPAGSGGWTDLVDITTGPMMVQLGDATDAASDCFLYGSMHSDEAAGDDMRMQILIDSTVVLDMTLTADHANIITNYWKTLQIDSTISISEPIYCNSSFKIRAAIEVAGANLVSGSTALKVGNIRYRELDL